MSPPPTPSTIADWLRTLLPRPPQAPPVVTSRTLAQESVLRFACALWATAPTADLTEAQRAWLLARLQAVDPAVPFSPQERQAIQQPLLAWIQAAHPGIVALVAKQFEE